MRFDYPKALYKIRAIDQYCCGHLWASASRLDASARIVPFSQQMNEKPVKLPMDFGDALIRLARTPKTAIDKQEQKQSKAKASRSPPRSGGRKTA
jgi:hypothetical protein